MKTILILEENVMQMQIRYAVLCLQSLWIMRHLTERIYYFWLNNFKAYCKEAKTPTSGYTDAEWNKVSTPEFY